MIRMDKDGHELSCWYGRTMINNKCRLDYAAAQVQSQACGYWPLPPNAPAQAIIDGSVTRAEQLEERYRCCILRAIVQFILRIYIAPIVHCTRVLFHLTFNVSAPDPPPAYRSPALSATCNCCSRWRCRCAPAAWLLAALT